MLIKWPLTLIIIRRMGIKSKEINYWGKKEAPEKGSIGGELKDITEDNTNLYKKVLYIT